MKLRYHGFQFCDSIPADNRQYNQDCLKKRPRDKNAQEAVELDKLIEPGKPYTRLGAHKVAVYRVKDPQWNSRGRFSIPRGELETIVEVDLGVEFIEAVTGTKEVVIKKEAKHYFPDGSFIKGPIMKLVPGECQLGKLEDFLEIKHDLEGRKRKTNEFDYSFGIKKEIIDLANPLEIHVEEYVKIGSNLWLSKKEAVLVARYDVQEACLRFGLDINKQKEPVFKLIYRATSPNVIIK